MAFPDKIAQKLASSSAYICNYDGCSTLTLGPAEDPMLATKIGQAAHIEGEKPTSARHNPSLKNVHDVSNGIWLCANCHAMIDKNNGIDYSVNELKKWKSCHKEIIDSLLKMHKSPLPLMRRYSINVSIAQAAIDLAENCGALFQPKHLENPDHVIRSIENLRKSLISLLRKVKDDAALRKQICVMRDACREVMNYSSNNIDELWDTLAFARLRVRSAARVLRDDFGCSLSTRLS